ncbi:MAG: hypothetical protein WD042_07500 [Phycisphaeraceae bacterium]
MGVALVCALAASARAAEETLEAANARIAEMERQITALRAEATMLRMELGTARTAAVPTDIPADKALPPTDEAAAPNMGEAITTMGDRAAPQALRAIKTYRSAPEILRDVPPECHAVTPQGPSNEGLAKANDWLASEATRHDFDGLVPLGSVRVEKLQPRSPDDKPAWRITASFGSVEFDYAGHRLKQVVAGSNVHQALEIRTLDERLVQRVQRIAAGTRIRVSGRIAKVELVAGTRYHFAPGGNTTTTPNLEALRIGLAKFEAHWGE